MNSIIKSDFTNKIINLNHLNSYQLKAWLIKPGMHFGAQEKWWGNKNSRATSHEGLDLATLLDIANNRYQLSEKTIVPPLYRGRLVNIIDDFLGQTMIINHEIINCAGEYLHGFYAHLSINKGLEDIFINDNDILGTIAPGKDHCPSHLHISTVWIAPDFPIEQLSWVKFIRQQGFQPCDPMLFIKNTTGNTWDF